MKKFKTFPLKILINSEKYHLLLSWHYKEQSLRWGLKSWHFLCYSAHIFWHIVHTCRWDWRSWQWSLYVASKWRTQRLIERKEIIIFNMKAGFGIPTFLMFYKSHFYAIKNFIVYANHKWKSRGPFKGITPHISFSFLNT